ncbi:MAG: metal-dependent hydrolase [Candidatus Dasytiphilus stammeri]
MTSRSHIIFIFAMIIAIKRFHIITYADWWHIIPGAILTSLLPDIDHPKSLIGQRLKCLSYPIAYFFGHRGFTHSLLAVIVCSYLIKKILQLPLDIQYGMLMGYISHLTADWCTSAGIPLLWPLPWKFRVPLFHISTGKLPERFLCLFFLLIVITIPSNFFMVITPYLNKLVEIQRYCCNINIFSKPIPVMEKTK